ncbi:MAG: Xylan 1,4-beta-xylosidase precursor [Bacteroidetes bacterium ADurb.BinA395]|nr:MAG: Xylan 1,4-beta-xylosidase precursor [Bacteroidetes bacterium ADurb.BinA395]
MNPASFSIRWEGVLVPPVSGKYAIGGEAFNGFDIYLNGEKLVKGRKSDHDPRREYEFIELEAGKKYDLRFDYLQNNTEYAIARLVWDKPNNQMLKEAVDVAKSSDIVILCMGLSPSLEGEEMKVKVAGFDHGDRLDIQLPAIQTNLMKEIMKLGKPTVLVLLNGSAIAFNWESENIPAILESWYPGQAGGTAIADILFGDYNPSGHLPLTFYKSIDQIPAFDVYDMKGKTYRYFNQKPLYEFGFGLSYSTFEYSKVAVPAEIKAGENIKVSVNVKNTSKISGDEVVQLYVSLPESKLQKPIRSLQGFKRVYLKVGETKTVEFELKPAQFAARDNNNVQIVEPGIVEISVGGKQPDESSILGKKVVKFRVKIVGDKFFISD